MSDVKISAADVKRLRDMTGAGMMDCKKALAETGGDFDAAIEFLRKKGQKLSAKRADRDAKEGCVLAVVSEDNSKGVVVRLSCETDFVSKNDEFVAMTQKIADLALSKFPETKEDLLKEDFGGISLAEKIIEQTGVIGEKVELADYQRLEAPMVASYIHMGNRAGVIVGLSKASDSFMAAGKDVAMQVAAMKPIAVDKDGVSQDIIQKEIEIGKDVARQEGKPEAILEKIATGKLNKFFKENTLLNQAFVKDNKKSISQFLTSIDSDLTVTDFKHVKLG
ncbi:MAG: translation elongation factor Ts [Saprospiraceae bacterium]|nr:translation elongation factor Ts [Saprospiraceae bacterium]